MGKYRLDHKVKKIFSQFLKVKFVIPIRSLLFLLIFFVKLYYIILVKNIYNNLYCLAITLIKKSVLCTSRGRRGEKKKYPRLHGACAIFYNICSVSDFFS